MTPLPILLAAVVFDTGNSSSKIVHGSFLRRRRRHHHHHLQHFQSHLPPPRHRILCHLSLLHLLLLFLIFIVIFLILCLHLHVFITIVILVLILVMDTCDHHHHHHHSPINAIVINSSRNNVACNTDGTKLLVESVCETASKSLFWVPLVYKDLNTRHDWPVKKAIVDLLVRLKRNSKRISCNSLSSLGFQNKPFGAAPQTLITSAMKATTWRTTMY